MRSMAGGQWQMADGRWQMANGGGRVCHWPFAISYLLFAMAFGPGCTSAKPPATAPPAVSMAGRAAAQAAKLSQNQHWSAAAREWRLAADDFALLNDRAREAIALHNLAQAQRELGQLEDARRLLEQAATLNEKFERTNEWWRNQIALLQLEAQSGQTNSLNARFEQLASPSSRLKDRSLRGLFLNELGLWELRQHHLTKAERAFLQAEEQFQAVHDAPGIATLLANRAQLYEEQKDFPAAINAWRLALSKFEALADPPGITRALAGQGRALLEAQKDLPLSEDLLRQAARNFRTLQAQSDLEVTLELLVQCLNAQGKSEETRSVRSELQKLSEKRAPQTGP